MKKILFILCLFITSVLFGQNLNHGKWCKVGDYIPPTGGDLVNNKNPLNSNSLLIDPNGVIIIPVVFHVLYNLSQPAAEDIPVALINSQIERLNTDFNLQNPDVSQVPGPWSNLPANIKIQFKLACVDPQGNPTDGIKRIATTNYSFFQSHFYDAKRTALGGHDAWPTDTYLNIWTCNMEANLGDAMFPWEYNGSTNGIPHNLLDGIVLHYEVVGDNNSHATLNKGRVAVHEVGHWLGLRHIYFNGCYGVGDEVNDTPPQDDGNYNTCPTFPQLGTICSTQYPGHMFMNYMDQVTDACRYMFTVGQRDRMRSYFAQNGPSGTRFPFIQNYFGIKHFATNPYVVQNNTITVFMNNPACLPVTYNYTGPVTEISHDDQKIIFSVACGSGTVSLTATSGNYTDTYVFDFINSGQSAEILPSSYFSWGNGPQNIIPNSLNVFCVPWEDGRYLVLNASYASGNLWYINDTPIPVTGSYPNIGWVFINNNTSQLSINNFVGRYKFQIKNDVLGCGILSPPTYVESINIPFPNNEIGFYKPNFNLHISAYPGAPSGYGELYTWSIPGTVITNANPLTSHADVYFPSNIPLPIVTGTLTISNSPYCNGTFNIFFTYSANAFSSTIGDIGNKKQGYISIYPNPATNQITITSAESISYIEISDLMNPTLKRVRVNNIKSVTLNVSDLKPGIYNCRITTDKGTENQKLIINR